MNQLRNSRTQFYHQTGALPVDVVPKEVRKLISREQLAVD